MTPTISVIVPAHNEAAYLPACLEAVDVAREQAGVDVEVVVVLNRCTDGTRAIAEAAGARCVLDESRCIAAIRNRGVASSTGETLITCDADSRLHPTTFQRMREQLADGAVGGGVSVRFDRRSAGIRATELLLDFLLFVTRVPCGAFWTTRAAFDAVQGFDERLPMGEDIDFGKRLRAWGRARGAPYELLRGATLLTSSRKFDHFGDWSFFRMLLLEPLRIRRSMKGRDTEFVDEYFYDFNDRVAGAVDSGDADQAKLSDP
jgi:glycosyltransferase involved in cell wall biosynthesis